MMFSRFREGISMLKEARAEDRGVCYQDPCDKFFLEFKFRNKGVSKDGFKCFAFLANNHP